MRAETSLHADLKNWYTLAGGRQEVNVDGYWIDVVDGDQLVEIQTRNFYALKDKLAALLEQYPVRVVHPIALEKWIVTLPQTPDGDLTRRKSPYHGRLEYLFKELVGLPELLAHPNFSLEVILVREEEVRQADGRGSWRRKGVSIVDRRLVEIVHQHLFSQPDDLRRFLPPDLAQPFTNQELARRLKIPVRLAGRMTYCLRRLNIIQQTGKRGRAGLHTIL
jgi:hypothetical protein